MGVSPIFILSMAATIYMYKSFSIVLTLSCIFSQILINKFGFDVTGSKYLVQGIDGTVELGYGFLVLSFWVPGSWFLVPGSG